MNGPAQKYSHLAAVEQANGRNRYALQFRLIAAEHCGHAGEHEEAEAEYRAASVLCERMADFHSSQRSEGGANRGKNRD